MKNLNNYIETRVSPSRFASVLSQLSFGDLCSIRYAFSSGLYYCSGDIDRVSDYDIPLEVTLRKFRDFKSRFKSLVSFSDSLCCSLVYVRDGVTYKLSCSKASAVMRLPFAEFVDLTLPSSSK